MCAEIFPRRQSCADANALKFPIGVARERADGLLLEEFRGAVKKRALSTDDFALRLAVSGFCVLNF
jgi:hypothetical protein